MATKNFTISDEDRNLEETVIQEAPTRPHLEQKNGESVKKISYTVEISWKTIAMILAVAAALYLGFKLLVPIVILFFAFAVTSAVLPMVRMLNKKGVPKGVAIFIVYLILLVMMGLLALVMAQPLSDQIGNISKLFNSGFKDIYGNIADFVMIFWKDVDKATVVETIKNFFTKDLAGILNNNLANAGKAVDTVANIGTFVGYFVFSIVLSVYFVADHDNFIDFLLLRVVDERKSKLIKNSIEKIETQLGMWLRGQALLSLIIGGLSFVFLTIVGVPYAIPLAIIAGLTESIPTIGPTIGAIPAILAALFALSPGYALVVLVGYLVIQWLENNLIVPKVMGGATGLRPVIVILAVFTGLSLFGIVGAVFAVPMAVVIKIMADFYLEFRKITAES